MSKDDLEKAEMYASGGAITDGGKALNTVLDFVEAGRESLSALPETDKRSLQSGVRILNAYFNHYHNDGFHVAHDSQGPLIERLCSHTMYEDDKLKIIYFGTIDVVLENKTSGVLLVADHKTTAQLGSEFYSRCHPNFQYTGYVWLAQKSLGLNTNMFMINGLQTAKTKTEFARQITARSEEDFNELRDAVVHNVHKYLDSIQTGVYPQNTPGPCSFYGGCTYRALCEVSGKLRDNVMQARYARG